jgi:hypothetical protein
MIMSKLTIEPGQRKLIATVITMIVGVVADKYFGGLGDNLAILIGSALALFVGGNAMEYVAQIKTGNGKVSSLPPEKEEVAEVVDVPTSEVSQIQALSEHLTKLDNICGQYFNKYDTQFKEMQGSIDLQAKNIQALIKMLNEQRGVNEKA